jgi:hypothetical protein
MRTRALAAAVAAVILTMSVHAAIVTSNTSTPEPSPSLEPVTNLPPIPVSASAGPPEIDALRLPPVVPIRPVPSAVPKAPVHAVTKPKPPPKPKPVTKPKPAPVAAKAKVTAKPKVVARPKVVAKPKVVAAPKPRPVPTVAAARSYALSRLGSTQYRCLNLLWTRESGWNPAAFNPDSGAYGIPQALPGSKMSAFGSDWRTNPMTQVRWGLSYIAGRYGTACGAWSHSQSVGWY